MRKQSRLVVVIGAVMAISSMGAFAQGQGSVEAEVFTKRYFTDSSHDMQNGNLVGASASYFITDNISTGISYGEYHHIKSDNAFADGRKKKVNGEQYTLDGTYSFGEAGSALRPYVTAGIGHQSLSNLPERTGRNHTTFLSVGAGAKYYLTENIYAKAGIDGIHGLDSNQSEWMAGAGVGYNFGKIGK